MSGTPPLHLSRSRRALFGIVFATLLLGLTELVLRAALGPPPPPVKVYNAIGDHKTWFEVKDGRVNPVYINIDPPEPFPAEWNGKRCAALGGSTVHGGTPSLNMPGEFPNLVGQTVGFPVLNLASPGLDSFDHVEIVSRLVQWRFSCLVLLGGHNDFGNAYFQKRYGTLASGLQARARAGLENFQIFVQLNRMLAPLEGVARSEQTRGGGAANLVDDEAWWAALRYLEANTRRIVWTANKHGIKTIIVSPPSGLHVAPGQRDCSGPSCPWDVYQEAQRTIQSDPQRAAELFRRARDLDRLALRAPSAAQEALQRVAEDEGAVFVDAERLLPQEATVPIPDHTLFKDGVHFTAAGHQAMARLLAPYVYDAVNSP